MFKAGDVQLTVALVDFAVPILGTRGAILQALLALLLKHRGVIVGHVGRREVDVLVDAQDLQALHDARPQEHPVSNAAGVAKISRSIVHDQVFGVHSLGDRPIT